MDSIFELMSILNSNIANYRNGNLYSSGKDQEKDKVVYKYVEFSQSFDKYCEKCPEEKEKLALYFFIDYTVKHYLIDG